MTDRTDMTDDNDNALSEEPNWVGDPAELGAGSRLQDDDLLLLGNPVADPCLRHVSEIICLDTIGGNKKNTTRISFTERIALVRKPLRRCAARLNPRTFFQANQGCIINLAHIRQTKIYGRNYLLVLSNNREVLVSRRHALRLRKARAL